MSGRAGGLRADAARNRDQIIDAATVLFGEHGLDVSTEAVARRAGVGVGTLYRRFPVRGDLLVAVATRVFRDVADEAERAVEAEPSAWDAFVRLVTTSRSLRLTVRIAVPAPEAWDAVHVAEESSAAHAEMLAALDSLIGRAQAEGAMRDDIGSGDALNLVTVILASRSPDADPIAREWADRWLHLMLDGLRSAARRHGQLPGRPVTVDDLRDRAAQVHRPDAV